MLVSITHAVRRTKFWYCTGLIAGCLTLFGCSSVSVQNERELRAMPAAAPKTIYVADFELNAQYFHSESGILPIAPQPSGPLGLIPRLLGVPQDPGARARELVNLMSSTLIEDLTNAGLNARHLRVGENPPGEGWLVRGTFMQIDEGNRLRRALIGFGNGKTELQVVVSVSDMAEGLPKPFYEMGTITYSSERPGAVISFNPYAAASRFVLCGLDLDTNVMQTASRIAGDIAERFRTGSPPRDLGTELLRLL